ncbi:nucleotide exchange factor GrpE [Halobellus rufus]|uniref:nucleotide exchange factor GrpE n=1 Tax=Halobellus rufus TaxID=1448860 RepID=UPI00067933A3|nr:nucleotide exchange factor GrpE [Halobellus rufus]
MTEESPERAATVESDETDAEDVDREQDGTDPATNGTETGAETAGAAADADGDAAADVPDLSSRVAEYDDDLADAVSDLESRVATAESELAAREERIEELESALKRSKADFKNYKQRAKKRQEEIRERATEDFVGRVVSVRDNLVRALEQDEDADIRPGIESTLEEFDRILDDENVSAIDPESGEDVDPTRHEVLMRVDDDQPEGTVVDVFQPGYEMAGSVLREAQVTVSTGEGSDGDDS